MIPSAMIAVFTSDYPFPNYGSLELPEQLSDRVIFFAEFLPRLLYAFVPRLSPQMSSKNRFQHRPPRTDEQTGWF